MRWTDLSQVALVSHPVKRSFCVIPPRQRHPLRYLYESTQANWARERY